LKLPIPSSELVPETCETPKSSSYLREQAEKAKERKDECAKSEANKEKAGEVRARKSETMKVEDGESVKPVLSAEEKAEKDRLRAEKRQKLYKKIKEFVRQFSELCEDYDDEEITLDDFWTKGKKIIRKLATIELAVKKNKNHMEETNREKFFRKLNRCRVCFEDAFDNIHEMKGCLMKMNKKDKDDYWQYNYVTQEACLQSDVDERFFRIPLETYLKLHAYQRKGLSWMFELFCDEIGGVLADDMGLGKTVMACAFLKGVMGTCRVKKALLVVPVSTITAWQSHLKDWTGKRVRVFRGTEEAKMKAFEKVIAKGGVLISTYETVRRSIDILTNTKFDYCILDEAHKCKNPHSGQSQAIRKLRVRNCRRLMLTGTYMQNKMEELWALIDWCTQGKILGPYRDFRSSFARSIDQANVKDATRVEKEIAESLRQELREIIEPYIMRRTKNEVGLGVGVQKNEMILWIQPTDMQKDIYNKFLKSQPVQAALNASKSALAALTSMKKICDHPFILNESLVQQCSDLEDLQELQKDPTCENILKASAKLAALKELLQILHREGHKVLIFSGYVKTMSFIRKIISSMNCEMRYIDGTVDSAVRQKYIDDFNNEDSTIFAFCSTTGVGGLGLTITGADRVVLFDPDWNPANDSQAVDRAFRLGQTRNVVVYRFVTCETIEDKIYRRQVSKQGLLEMIDTGGHVKKFFTRDELKRVFTPLEDCSQSQTQKLMIANHPHPYKSYPELEAHIEQIKNLNYVFDISHHDEIFKLRVNQCLDDEASAEDEEVRKKEDEKIKNALEEKLKAVREDKKREQLLSQQQGGSPVLTKRKKRKLAALKNGWDHKTFNTFAGTPPEKKKKKKAKATSTPADTPQPSTAGSKDQPTTPPFNPLSPTNSVPELNKPLSPHNSNLLSPNSQKMKNLQTSNESSRSSMKRKMDEEEGSLPDAKKRKLVTKSNLTLDELNKTEGEA